MEKLEVHQWRIGIKKDKIIYYSTTGIFLKERKTVVKRKHEHNNMGPVKCMLNSRLNFQIGFKKPFSIIGNPLRNTTNHFHYSRDL